MIETNVVEIRKKIIEDLKQKVDEAFLHKEEDTELTLDGSISNGGSSDGKTRMDDFKKDKELAESIVEQLHLGIRPEDITVIHGQIEKPNVVWVDNPHDYRELLYLTIKKSS